MTAFARPFLALVLAAGAALAAPVQAQEAAPLLRVYIDAPYYYEIMAAVLEDDGEGTYRLQVYAEGKEVGESEITYHCADGSYEETVTSEWSGRSGDFMLAALMAFNGLHCGM